MQITPQVFSLSQILQSIMFSSNACRFVLLSFLSLSANAESVRGVHRELPSGELTVTLGTAANYAILAKTGISTVPTSRIVGSIAVSPITAAAMTGFGLVMDSSQAFSTSPQIEAGYTATAANYGGNAATALTTAVSDMETAYTDAKGRPNDDGARKNLNDGELDAVTLTTGVYTFGTDVLITGEIRFAGSDTDIFIIQITGNLALAAGSNVVLDASGATTPKAENIFWQVTGAVTVGAGAHMEGIILGKTAVTFLTGSSLDGRVLAQTACTLQKATIDSSDATIGA
jgi:hypothetical protein